MKLILISLILIVIVAIIGCSNDSTTGPASNRYTYYNYVHFDTAQFVFSKYEYPPAPDNRVSEPAVDWENSLGEPYFDLNGNGIYEPDIDSFVTALDPDENQDLNRNNQYDGPDDPWEPGIPFDDLNGNGEYDGRPDTFSYFPGIPFCDHNSNGIRDTDLHASYGIFCFQCERLESGDFLCDVETFWNDRYKWTSDSGSTYNIYLQDIPITVPMLLSDSGIGLNSSSLKLHILDKGPIRGLIDEEYTGEFYGQPAIFKKSIQVSQMLIIDNVKYRNLVFARFEHPEIICEFYFSQEHGFLGFGWNRYGGDEMHYCYFHRQLGRDHPPVLPMKE